MASSRTEAEISDRTQELRRASHTRLRRLAPLTTRVFNPVTRLVASWLPGFGVLRTPGGAPGADIGRPSSSCGVGMTTPSAYGTGPTSTG